MRKTLTRTLVPIGVAAAVIAIGAGAASATTPTITTPAPSATTAAPADQFPSLDSIWRQWDKGGAALGYGAASLVSTAFLGIPKTAVDLVHNAAGMG